MTTAGYFIKPDGSYFQSVSMGGAPLEYRQHAAHPEIQKIERLNPDVTHVEFRRVIPTLYATVRPRENYGLPVYVFARALRLNGPLIHERFEEVPLVLEPEAVRP
jgi:hypothetical protein